MSGLLEGFDELRASLTTATRRALAARLRAGQSREQILRELPSAAASVAVKRFPNAYAWQESVLEFVRRVVEEELGPEVEVQP